jgi:hypothetical protein
MSSPQSLAARIARLEAIMNVRRDVGQWVRNLAGSLVFDPWGADAAPDHDAAARLLAESDVTAERLATQSTPASARDNLDAAVAPIAAGRQALRDFSAYVEAELARGVPLGEIADPVRV